MAGLTCMEDGCTLASTGVCLRNGGTVPCDRATTSVEDEVARHVAEATPFAPTGSNAAQPEVGLHSGWELHPGVELGLRDIEDLMSEEYAVLVGILGEFNAGKTFFLIALYLMLASGASGAKGYAFAGSLTLPGFEDRARASRKWTKGAIPQGMSVHTSVTDDRGAGFLHLDVLKASPRARHRLLLSDLPGEWTTELLKSSRYAERLSFLVRADAILVMVEGPNLQNDATRLQQVERHKILIERVAAICPPNGRRLAIVATKGDCLGMTMPAGVGALVEHAARLGFAAKGILIAALSGDPRYDSGSGVFDVMDWVLAPAQPPAKRVAPKKGKASRSFGWALTGMGEMAP